MFEVGELLWAEEISYSLFSPNSYSFPTTAVFPFSAKQGAHKNEHNNKADVAIATIVSTLLSTFATIAQVTSGGFASGGVVRGGSYVGDHNIFGLNAGETVLTSSQSASLWSALESGRLGYNRPFSSSDITFKIKGSDLYGALNNYNKIKSKTR